MVQTFSLFSLPPHRDRPHTPIINITHQSGTFITKNEPTLAHPYHSKAIVYLKVHSCVMCTQLLSHVQLFGTHALQPARVLCPWGFSRQLYWSGLPCTPPGDCPNPGTEPRSPELQSDSLSSEPSGKVHSQCCIFCGFGQI